MLTVVRHYRSSTQTLSSTEMTSSSSIVDDIANGSTVCSVTPTIPKPLLDRMNSKSDTVTTCYSLFRDTYKTSMRETYISEIIDGEVIETKPDNIMVDTPPEPAYAINEDNFARFCSVCSKRLYKYQADAIRKIRELELRGYHINPRTGDKIISNGWLLSLPIGSGKSLVFQFLSIFYRDVPRHPIIISRDGRDVPDFEQAELKIYPFYYESCGYIEGKANAVITLTDYVQRPCTVIITHQHLLQQMREYFHTDFPKIVPHLHIEYVTDINEVKDLSVVDILVVVASSRNMHTLMEWSYEKPFSRVIIDDYTSMPSIESFRQVRASSTIFVSGSGFNRKESDIPASYYTLKFMPVPMITLVGKPEETYEGIFRDSVATMELVGSSCKFSQYKFVGEVEEYCRMALRANPTDVYPLLKDQPTLHNYLALMFIIKNADRFKGALMAVEHDLTTINPATKQPYLAKDRLRYYYEWKEMMSGIDSSKIAKGRNGKPVKVESNNPLYRRLYDDMSVGNGVGGAIVPDAVCMCCGKEPNDTNGYGMLATCCGAFYCPQCVESATTRLIRNDDTDEMIEDHDNYYCCCCRRANPKFMFNVSRKKDSSVWSFNIANDYFDVNDVADYALFDYYFYMFLHGFVPCEHKGKPLNVAYDVRQGAIEKDCFKRGIVPKMDRILPKDQLAILTLSNINYVLHKLSIVPKRNSIILFFGCPSYMQDRVTYFYNDIVKKNEEETAMKVKTRRGVEMVQPIAMARVVFKDDVGSLIGLHENIIAIIAWETPTEKDNRLQVAGRLIRINSWGNQLTFYISTNSIGYA